MQQPARGERTMGMLWAFALGLAAGSGVLVGAFLGLVARLRHRTVAAVMSIGAGVLLSLASVDIASEALDLIGSRATIGGVLAGAATFSLANAALESGRHRKRCGECRPQPTEADAPGSGTAIALGTALDAVPEALILGIALRAGGPDKVLILAIALSNLPEALSGTAGMRQASRSIKYVVGLWSGIALATAAMTAVGFAFVGDLGVHATTILKAYGAGTLLAMAAETMIPEAFHDGPRYSGLLAAVGFSALTLLGEIAR
jgi:ZIP family zinc transporter